MTLEKITDLPPLPPEPVFAPCVLPGVVDAAGRTWALDLAGAITVDGVPVDALDVPPGTRIQCATLTVSGVAYVTLVDAAGQRSDWRAHSGAGKQGEVTR